ncbi:hypothetical protein NR798_24220 [Archangium gephyra]|uniref:hypothetical protein n=1 Tax=Archangium gephyra TaxID=48 RepID=UPI0035D3F439
MTDAQLVAVCRVVCARTKKSVPGELWTERGPTELALQLRESNPWSSGERALFQVAWAVWNSEASTLTLGELLNALYGEHLVFVGSLLVAMGQGSEAVSRWLKAQGVVHAA